MSGPFSQNNVTVFANIAALRSASGAGLPPVVYLQGATTLNDGGQAFYALGAFGQADNGTTIIVTSDNYCFNQATIPETIPGGVISVSEGGTGLATLTSGAFLTGNGAGNVNFTIPAAGIATFITTPTSANLAAAVTDETGSGSLVFGTSPTLVTPALGTPASGVLTNTTGYPVASLANLGTGVATFLTTPSSANLAAAITDETGSGSLVFSTSPTFVTPLLGTPTSGVLTNCTGYPVANIANLGTGVATWLATPSSANLLAALTTKTGTGNAVFGTSPTLVTPVLGAASATSVAFSSTSGVIGTTTNDSAAAGSVGEFVTSSVASGSAVSLTSPNAANLTSISLTAGDWDIWGNVISILGATTQTTIQSASINTTSATMTTPPAGGYCQFSNTVAGLGVANSFGLSLQTRLSLSGTTTVYLVCAYTFSISTCSVYGSISARRRR